MSNLEIKKSLVPAFGRIAFVTEDIYIKGGMRSVTTKQSRDSIALSARKAGMLVYVNTDDKYYRLKQDLATWEEFNSGGLGSLSEGLPDTWVTGKVYKLGDHMVPTALNGHFYRCVNPGTSAVTEPAWTIAGGITNDGTAKWQDRGLVTGAADASKWIATHVYGLNSLIQPRATANGRHYKCTTPGTSNPTEPTWPITTGETVTDGTAVWTDMGLIVSPAVIAGGSSSIGILELTNEPTLSQSRFLENSVVAFDYTDCDAAPNFIEGTPTSFTGLNFSSAGGERLVQMGFGVVGGTQGMYARVKATTVDPWSAWMLFKASSGTNNLQAVSKTAHGYTTGVVIAVDPTGAYVAARADNSLTAEVVGVCTRSLTANSFELASSNGFLESAFTGLTAGKLYYLSSSIAGALTDTPPTTPGHVSKPVLVATSATSGYFINARGVIVPSPLVVTSAVNLDTAGLVANVLSITNNSGSATPLVQVQDTTGKIRTDVVVTVSVGSISFNFAAVSVPTGIWKAVIIG